MRTDVYVRPRIVVAYAGNRVAAMTTRSPADVGGAGLGVGRRPARRVLRHCPSGVGDGRCVLATGARKGRRTTLILRDGRIAAMRIEISDAPGAAGRSDPPRTPPPPLPVAGARLSPLTTASGAASWAWWWARAGAMPGDEQLRR